MSSRKSTKVIVSDHTTEITVRTGPNEFSKSCIWVESDYFYGTKHARGDDRYLIVGFDTEFKTPDEALTPDDIKDGLGKYKVLSYQFHCSIYDPDQPEAEEWSGICYSQDGERLKLSDILTFAFHEGISKGAVKKLPNKVYLAGHFTRADFPALADFQTLTELIASVRATFLSIDNCIPIQYFLPDGGAVKVDVVLRDTMLLTPATSKSLRALGELVGVEKITLDADPEKELFYKQNMDVLLAEKPDLFDRYAINDAVICVRYLEQLIGQCEAILGKRKVPATLTGIGVDLLMNTWKNDGFNPLEMIGKEAVTHSYFNKRLGRHFKKDVVVYQQEVSWHVDLATECYHGGRNEQFWFGPAFEDNWTDYDLAGAYPTAMALIGTADWRGIRVSLDLKDYTPTTLGMANIEFEFPESVRFPTLPVRTSNGLVFPRTGRSDCAAPEIALAVSLGAKVTIRHGVIIPTNRDQPAFGNFISQCIHKRKSYPKGSLQNLFWKELSNSSYGKTAQGLHHKRVYDLRDRDTKPLPESKITNPFFAAYITSFVRSALGEIMNSLPPEVCVFSCTTDGFLTNATQAQIDRASSGPIADLYRQSRETLTGDPTMLEIKHTVRKPLGWRTRGQATLIEGRSDSGGANIVLAKGGIYTPEYIEDQRALNGLIVNMFLDRSPDDRIPLKIKTGIRDIVEFDADLVDKHVSKRLNMEFDWKRMPYAVWQDEEVGHVAFSTQPWESVDDFVKVRQHWESFAVVTPRCIKTKEDYAALATYIFSQSALEEGGAAYLKKQAPDIKRLRQMLCLAWKRSAAGITRKFDGHSDASFADLLTSIGIPCKRTDVENARKPFLPHMCPPTSVVIDALDRLKAVVPSLETDLFLSQHRPVDILAAHKSATSAIGFDGRLNSRATSLPVGLARPPPGRTRAVELDTTDSNRMHGGMTDQIARIRITLEDMKPAIWRRVELPVANSLKTLHLAIQACMLFENYHLFRFDVGDAAYGIRFDDDDAFMIHTRDAANMRISKLVERGITRFTYTYDFGDNWRHRIEIEEITTAIPGTDYPRFVDGERRAPPEDVGGTPGFEEFLNAMAKPRHPERTSMVQWYGGVFDPTDIGPDEVNARMAKLAKRRTQGKAAYADAKARDC